jgi:hypothetical protein
LESGIDSIATDFTNLKEKFVGGWNVIMESGKLVWQTLKQAFGEFWNWIASTWVGKKLHLGVIDVGAATTSAEKIKQKWDDTTRHIEQNNAAYYARQRQRDKQQLKEWEQNTKAAREAADPLAGAARGLWEKQAGVTLPAAPSGGGLTPDAHAADIVAMLQDSVLAEEEKTAEVNKQQDAADGITASMREAEQAAKRMAGELADKIRGGKEATLTHGRASSAEFYERRAQQEYGKVTGQNPEEDARRVKRAEEFERRARRMRGVGTDEAMEAYAGTLRGKRGGGKDDSGQRVDAAAKGVVDEVREMARRIEERFNELGRALATVGA